MAERTAVECSGPAERGRPTTSPRPTRQRLLLALSGTAAAGLAAACGVAGGSTAEPPSGASANGVKGPVTLRYAADKARLDAGVQQVIDLFNRRGPITVEADVGAAVDKILTQAAAGDPPDVTHTHPRDYHAWVNAGALIPLDAYMKRDKQNVPDIVPTALDYWLRDGQRWGMPNNLSVQNVFFNKEMFDRRGLKTPDQLEKEGKWTLENYLDLARQLTTGSGESKVFGAVWRQDALDIQLGMLWPFGAELWDKKGERTALDSKEALEAIQFQADLTAKYGISPNDEEWKQFAAAPSNTWGAAFSAGKAAIEIQPNDSLVPHVLAATFPKGMAPMPTGRAGRIVRGLAVGANLLKGSKQADAAWEWANFQAGKESEKVMLESHVSLPWHKSTLDRLEQTMPMLSWESAGAYAEGVKKLRATPYVKRFSDITRLYSVAYVATRAGQKSAVQMVTELRPQIDALLKD
jgi:multiple sugar transport system substrate-binding protein